MSKLHATNIPALIREALHVGKERYFPDGENLYLRVQPPRANSKMQQPSVSWVIRKRRKGRLSSATLGRWKDGKGMTLAQAREKAGKLDPKAAVQKMTLGEYLLEYYSDRVHNGYKRPHHLWGYIDRLKRDEPGLWNTKLRDVEHVDIFRAMKSYARNRGKVGATRCTAVLKTAFKYAVDAGYFSVSPIISLTAKTYSGKAPDRSRVLTDVEIHQLWHTDSSHTPLLRFLLLTGQRIGEAQLATWVHVVGAVWHIPAEHAKNGRAHWIPLPSAALDIINAEDRQRRKIFGHTSNTATQAWLKRWCAKRNIEPAFTPHDLRRTFATRLNSMGVGPHIVERMLNHTLEGVMKVYNHAEYTDERCDAAARWAVELVRLVKA